MKITKSDIQIVLFQISDPNRFLEISISQTLPMTGLTRLGVSSHGGKTIGVTIKKVVIDYFKLSRPFSLTLVAVRFVSLTNSSLSIFKLEF